jgi:hypothetical protein
MMVKEMATIHAMVSERPGSGLSVIAAETSLVSPNRHGSLCEFYDQSSGCGPGIAG